MTAQSDGQRYVTLPLEPMTVETVTLEGKFIRLEPLALAHFDALCEVGLDLELWRFTTSYIRTPDQMRAYLETALNEHAQATALPFATVEKSSGRVVGSTRLANIDRINHRAEIGWTWVGTERQRTPVNTEAKYLMLTHAFEVMGCLRVEFKTDSINLKSRAALLRIGAKEEGTFRNHMITDTGRIRHSVYFSIIDTEWPSVKAGLEEKLARPYAAQ
jgi:RimJ/RimL family protein N-acetyltransferase